MPDKPTSLMPTDFDDGVDWRSLVARLPILCLRLTFTTSATGWQLPEYVGGIVRGAFGAALFALSCPSHQQRCPPCVNPTECAYAKLFSMTSSSSQPIGCEDGESQAHPLVLNAQVSKDDRTLTIRLNLFGEEACQLQGIAVAAAIDCATHGLGRLRVRGELANIEVLDATGAHWQWVPGQQQQARVLQLPPRSSPTLRIKLHTPLRLFSQRRAVLPDMVTANLFLRALMRRASLLTGLYGYPGLMPAFHPWVRRAAALRVVRRQLQWRTETRYSARQDQNVSISGLLGEFTITGEGSASFWPLLKLGEITHVGKGTIHGLGEFELAAA